MFARMLQMGSLTLAVATVFTFAAPDSALADGYGSGHQHGRQYGGSYSRSYGGNYHGGRYGGGGYGGGGYGGYGRWHDTSHYDYHPGQYVRHGHHYHYIPGHYDLHRSGHWHR